MRTIVVLKQELGTKLRTMHILKSTLRKKQRDSPAYSKCSFLHMGTIVVFKQELGTYPWTMHILNSSEKKTQRFTCIQQVLCRNKIRPWCLVQGQL